MYLAAVITGISGAMFVTLSATPIPVWFYVGWAIVVIAGMIARAVRKPLHLWALPTTATLVTCTAIMWQFPYYRAPRLPTHPDDTFYLIGDSISAGIGTRDITCWPQLIQQQYRVNVVDLSFGGATVQSSLQRTVKIADDTHLVFLEIGGNDVLGRTSLPDFETSLDTLLKTVCRPQRTVVMLEIPLPPFCSDYGSIQRRLARRFGVILIPRRFFADVLTGAQATLDGIPLSQQGHEKMTRMVGQFLSPDFATAH
jgi:acyl-CoA thioesterase-1